MTKEAEEYLNEAQSKAVSNIAASILDYHSKHPIKELSDFAQQEVEKDRESRWISVDHALPEVQLWVLVWIPNNNMAFMAYRTWSNPPVWRSEFEEVMYGETVKFWQPLPKAPKL